MNTIHLQRAELQISMGKPLDIIKESLKQHFEEVNKIEWLEDMQVEYDLLYKTKEVINEDESISYEYVDDCISFNDWLNETAVIQDAIYENDILISDAIVEPLRPYIPIKVDSLVDNYIASKYRELRANEYPPIKEQLDMQYKDMVNGTTVWKDLITSIKDKYPKCN